MEQWSNLMWQLLHFYLLSALLTRINSENTLVTLVIVMIPILETLCLILNYTNSSLCW